MKLHWRMTSDGYFKPTRDLLTICKRNHGLQVVGHGNDREQHRDQNKIRDPRRGVRMNIV